MWHIKAIEKRMSNEDKELLSKIYEPKVVGIQTEDSRTGLCVMPDGEIRYYGEQEKDHPWKNGEPCYISSTDGGLTWKYHELTEEEMGSCTYIPEFGKYFAFENTLKIVRAQVWNKPYKEGTYVRVSTKGPDDKDFEVRKVSDVTYYDEFLPKYIKGKNRIAVTAQKVIEGDYHPIFIYSDDAGESWETVILKSAPRYEVIYPSVAPRWENNGGEPVFCEMPDGKLMLIARTSLDHFYVYYSDDYGTTWTDGEESDFHATLTTPYLLSLSNGKTLFLWNNAQPLAETNHANELPVHEDGFVHQGEGAFTNRDVCHAAISDDCVHWEGFRELYMNGVRNNADFRTIGGMRSSADKSVHQFQAIELPFGKVLVAIGQNIACRKLVIFDPKWLLEKERKEDFLEGIENVTTHVFVKSLSGDYVQYNHPGHCSWNRTNGALLMPDPDMDGTEALQICRTNDPRLVSDKQGVVWNFPCVNKGTVTVRMRIEGEGVKIALCDRWFNVIDEYAGEMSPFSFKLTPDTIKCGVWHDVKISFDTDEKMTYVYVDDRKLFGVKMKFTPDYGISYLHIQTDAECADYKGTFIKTLKMQED